MSDRDGGRDEDLAGETDDRYHPVSDEGAAIDAGPREDQDNRITPAAIGSILRAAREGIGDVFSADLFADPAFDMLLFVFLEEEAGRSVETSACYRASGVPRTTAVRWMNMLVSMGMFQSSPHPTDRRLALLRLSEEARGAVRRWLDGLRPLVERIAAHAAAASKPVA